jgi:hypothetical protein
LMRFATSILQGLTTNSYETCSQFNDLGNRGGASLF